MTTPARPADAPARWATGGAANKTPPLSQLKDDGWKYRDTPPDGVVNWFWFVVYSWILHFSKSSTIYNDLQDAIDDPNLETGSHFILEEFDESSAKHTIKYSRDTGVEWIAIHATGKSLVMCTFAGAFSMDLRNLDLMASSGSGSVQYTPGGIVGAAHNIHSDGTITVIAYDSVVECFDHGVDNRLWSFTHGASVFAIAIDSNHVYIAGGVGAGTKEVRALNRSTGAIVWSYYHNGTVTSIVTDGLYVIIRGALSGHGSGASIRSLEAANGNDKANEGGTAASSLTNVWDIAETVVPTGKHLMTSDENYIYTASDTTGTKEVRKYSKSDGSVIAEASITGLSDPTAIEVDQRYVYVSTFRLPDGEMKIYDKRDLALVGIFNDPHGTHDRVINDVASDGARVFLACEQDAPDRSLIAVNRGNLPGRRWKKVDPSTSFQLPFWRVAIPSEES